MRELVRPEDVEEAVPAQARALMPENGWAEAQDLTQGIRTIFESGLQEAGRYWKGALQTAGLVVSISLLCGLVSLLEQGKGMSGVAAAGVLATLGVCTGSLKQLVGLGAETVQQVQLFSNALLPAMAAAAVTCGAPSASAANYTAAVFAGNVSMLVFSDVFVPLVYAYIVTAAADAALENDLLSRIGELCKWVVTSGLKGILTVYLAWMSISGIISGAADAAMVKTAKLALSTAVPVVGSIISDASETVLISAGLLKNAVGVFGMLAVLAICIVPFLRLGIHYLTFKVTAAVCGCIGPGRLDRLTDALSSAMGMLLGMTGVSALMLIISVVCSMKAVTGA